MTRRFLSFVALLTFMSATSSATDLSKVDRTIAKEPTYKSKPKYCLLVFGPEAKTRVWLVQDGDTLYVDRNGNGDLTEPGKKVAAEKEEGAEEGQFAFKIGEIREGALVHKNLRVSVSKIDHLAKLDEMAKVFLDKSPKARGYYIILEVEMPGWHGTGVGGRVQQRAFYVDANGVLQFADKREEAPVIHFGGPWQISLSGRTNWRLAGRRTWSWELALPASDRARRRGLTTTASFRRKSIRLSR
jgi:hypothetical protein